MLTFHFLVASRLHLPEDILHLLYLLLIPDLIPLELSLYLPPREVLLASPTVMSGVTFD